VALALTAAASAQVQNFPAIFRTQEIATNDATIHVRVGGTGPAIVLLHGYASTGDMWAPLAADLARDHTVVVPDLRGLGLSSKPAGGFDKKTQASDVAGVLDTLTIAKADLVTHDIGTMVGDAFAVQYPAVSFGGCPNHCHPMPAHQACCVSRPHPGSRLATRPIAGTTRRGRVLARRRLTRRRGWSWWSNKPCSEIGSKLSWAQLDGQRYRQPTLPADETGDVVPIAQRQLRHILHLDQIQVALDGSGGIHRQARQRGTGQVDLLPKMLGEVTDHPKDRFGPSSGKDASDDR
jgi:pimeloyl-ACP methyl ester carboxylesterase